MHHSGATFSLNSAPILDISSILWTIFRAFPENIELQHHSYNLDVASSHISIIYCFYSYSQTELELDCEMCVVGSVVTDRINLSYLVKVPL